MFFSQFNVVSDELFIGSFCHFTLLEPGHGMWKRTSFCLSAVALFVQKEICSKLIKLQTFEKLRLSQGTPSNKAARLLKDGFGQVQPLIW